MANQEEVERKSTLDAILGCFCSFPVKNNSQGNGLTFPVIISASSESIETPQMREKQQLMTMMTDLLCERTMGVSGDETVEAREVPEAALMLERWRRARE